MKVLALVFFSWTLLFGDTYSALGYGTNYQKAITQAQAEGKLVMLLVVTQECPWCKKFSKKTLKKPEIEAFIAKHFVPVIVDRERDAAHFPQSYQTPRVPALFYINPAGHEVWTTVGYRTPKDLLTEFEEANQSYIEELTGVTH